MHAARLVCVAILVAAAASGIQAEVMERRMHVAESIAQSLQDPSFTWSAFIGASEHASDALLLPVAVHADGITASYFETPDKQLVFTFEEIRRRVVDASPSAGRNAAQWRGVCSVMLATTEEVVALFEYFVGGTALGSAASASSPVFVSLKDKQSVGTATIVDEPLPHGARRLSLTFHGETLATELADRHVVLSSVNSAAARAQLSAATAESSLVSRWIYPIVGMAVVYAALLATSTFQAKQKQDTKKKIQ